MRWFSLRGEYETNGSKLSQPIHSGTQTITLHTAAKSTFAGAGLHNFYVDRNSDDNVKDVTSG